MNHHQQTFAPWPPPSRPQRSTASTVVTVLLIVALAPIVLMAVNILVQLVFALLWQQAVQVHRTG